MSFPLLVPPLGLTIRLLLIAALSLPLLSCGMKLNEDRAHALMEQLYTARKKGSFHQEFKLYAKNEFKIVPFEEVEATLRTVVGSAGRFKSAKLLSSKVSRRNQLGKGLVSYLVLTYEATYANSSLHEAYYFLGDSELPKLVYMTLQFP